MRTVEVFVPGTELFATPLGCTPTNEDTPPAHKCVVVETKVVSPFSKNDHEPRVLYKVDPPVPWFVTNRGDGFTHASWFFLTEEEAMTPDDEIEVV